jgi:hypothetical protein
MKVKGSIVISTVELLLVMRAANALDPASHITQYAHTAWERP